MKKIIVNNVQNCVETGDKKNPKTMLFELTGDDTMEANDGYHSFSDLYEHRVNLYIRLCEKMTFLIHPMDGRSVWRSLLHSDGSSLDGWFILGINKEKGKQITYHLPLKKWAETDFAETLDKAPEWDGHTSDDVLDRLTKL